MELSDKDIIINRYDLFDNHQLIGEGDEGLVFNYDDKYAVKMFRDCDNRSQLVKLRLKLMKLKEMMSIHDDNINLPLGFVSFDGENVHGIYSRLIKHNKLFDFNDLTLINDKSERARYLIEGDNILQRIHEKGFIVGDVKPDNIMINDLDEVVYIDCDNYKYKNYLFDTIPTRAGFYFRVYGHDLAYQDNDKLVYTIMALELLTGDEAFNVRQNHEGLIRAVKRLNLDSDVERELREIISPKRDKPYVGETIKKMIKK